MSEFKEDMRGLFLPIKKAKWEILVIANIIALLIAAYTFHGMHMALNQDRRVILLDMGVPFESNLNQRHIMQSAEL